MEMLLGLIVGVGLAASCGFRVFAPLLVMSVASACGHLHLASGFEWIGSPVAVSAFGLATALEVAAFYIPLVDNVLDVVAVPAAAIAGTLATAACVHDLSPFLSWSVALVAGGGSALAVKCATAMTRLVSTSMTGGLGNGALATTETGGAITMAGFSIFLPLLSLLVTLGGVWLGLVLLRRWRMRRAAERSAVSPIFSVGHI